MNLIFKHLFIAALSLMLLPLHSSSFFLRNISNIGDQAAMARPVPAKPKNTISSGQLQIQSSRLRVEFDRNLRSRVVSRAGDKEIVLGPFTPSETARGASREWKLFSLTAQKREHISDFFGAGERFTLTGSSDSLTKTVEVTIYDNFPAMAVFQVAYTNASKSELRLLGWSNNSYQIEAANTPSLPAFWSYQSGSYEERPNWVLPLKPGFQQENYMGMNATDYGGGSPIVDVWRREVGLAVGHIERHPKLVSLPVSMPDARYALLSVRSNQELTIPPGETVHTLRTFVAVHQGDYFQTLVEYRRLMSKQGFQMASAPDSAFGAIWCAWGYGRNVQLKQVYGTLPTVKDMGFTWVTLDDGWQNNYGDWNLDPKKFVNGDGDMKDLVDHIHKEGFQAQLWWAPLMAVPDSKLLKEHPELVLKNRDGSHQKVSYWDSDYLCPADPQVIEYHKALVRKMLGEWGYDGLKLDGQHMNAVPPCYNPAHHHKRPEDSVEALPEFFRQLYETAKSVKPDAVVEFCPCGTAYSFFTMPHFNMSVASDPRGSFQVRSKGKTLKALIGDNVPYFGDHVELSDEHDDFASTIGVGGVVGTQFVLPELATKRSRSDLTPERKKLFEKWLQIYRDKMLSRGQYLGGLYDIGFDLPEAHVIRKDNKMYYAFFAKQWKGEVQLRGLEDRSYRIVNYVDGADMGVAHGPIINLPAEFEKHLLLEVRPE
jgi:alpha-galactosidase